MYIERHPEEIAFMKRTEKIYGSAIKIFGICLEKEVDNVTRGKLRLLERPKMYTIERQDEEVHATVYEDYEIDSVFVWPLGDGK